VRKIVLILTAALLLTACPDLTPTTPADNFRNARIGIAITRVVLTGAEATFMAVAAAHKTSCVVVHCIKTDPTKGAAYAACLTQDHTLNPEFQKCYGDMAKAVEIFPKVLKIAFATLDTGDQSIVLAEQLDQAKGDKKKIEEACAAAVKDEPDQKVKDAEYKKCVEQALANTPVIRADWQALLKKGSCLAYAAAALFPKAWDKYILPVRILLRGYGSCPN